MLMLALRLILKDMDERRGKTFWKRGNISKGCVEIENWGTSVYFVLGFQENYMYSMFAF